MGKHMIHCFILVLSVLSMYGQSKTTPFVWDSLYLTRSSDVNYLSSIEKEVFYELNKVRSSPKQYAIQYLEPMEKQYHDRYLLRIGEITTQTNEGVKALDECINVLKRTDSLPTLSLSKGLSLVARDIAEYQSKSGDVGHIGRNKSTLVKRIDQFGNWSKLCGENIFYGTGTGQYIVIALLIDDGVASRGHRNSILNPIFRTVGISVGTHPSFKQMSVMDFAGGYVDK